MTEREIIQGCILQDASCHRELFNQYAGRLMTVCLRYAGDRHEAEDILQEAFMIIFKNIQQYRSEGAFEKWLKRIVINCALRWIEKKKIHFADLTNEATNIVFNDTDALSSLSEEELLRLIRGLPNGYRIVFNLYVMEGYTHDEIAALLHIKPVTSRSQLLQAKRWLQQQILSMKKIAL